MGHFGQGEPRANETNRIPWIKATAAKYPEMDLSKGVGIFGGSAGSQSSTRALLAFGDFYTVAVSDCGCHDNRMDTICWNELWKSSNALSLANKDFDFLLVPGSGHGACETPVGPISSNGIGWAWNRGANNSVSNVIRSD